MPYQTVRALTPIRHSGVLRVPGQIGGENSQDFVVEDTQANRLVALGYATSLGVAAAPVVPGQATGGGGTLDKLLPIIDASKGYVTKCEKIENVATSASQTIIDTTAAGKPGVVSCIYLVTDTASFFRDGRMQVYVDGESTPSIDVEMHNFGTYNMQANNSYWTSRFQAQSADETAAGNNIPSATCIVFKYPIFYKTGVRIVMVPASGVTSRLFSNVIYHEGYTLPWKLKCSTRGYANRLTAQGKTQFENRQIKMLDRPSGQAGVIAGMTLTFPVFGASVLENNIVLYGANQLLDGTADPLFNTSGGEDFFGDFYFFANEQRGNTQWKFIATQEGRDLTGPSNFTQCVIAQDFLDHHGGIAYTDGAVLTFEKGKAAVPGDMVGLTVELFYSVWYYEPY